MPECLPVHILRMLNLAAFPRRPSRRYSPVGSTRRWPLFVAHELAALLFKVNATAARTIKPQHYRGAERAAEVTALKKKPAPTSLRAGFFKGFGLDRCWLLEMASPSAE